jgi:hypothetical protein
VVIAGLAETLVELLRDDARRIEMGRVGRSVAMARTWLDAAADLKDLLG